jgi:hypothetical protein
VVSVLRGEGQELDGPAGVTPVSAHSLLAGTIDRPTVWPVVHVPPEMVADLHEPRLIISPDYVGRDRRHGIVHRQPLAPPRRSTHRLAQAVIVALVTTAAVVPLTLMVAHQAPTATGPGRATRAQVHPATTARTPRVRPARASIASSAGTAARQGRSTDRAAAQSARAAAAADQRAARTARASNRAEQRSAAQAARATRHSAVQAARAARHGPG